ncbi:MAG: AsmA family protein [Herminiimonas sp.]|nr:AsmA family protein [Herminiimonas sp.]
MSKTVKYIVVALGALVAVLAVAAGIIAATFNPNDYKPLIVKLVQEKKQRTLAIPGEIKLKFFPSIGADLGRISISEHNGTAEFASINSARVSLQLIPLLSKRLVVDRVDIDGINANLTRFANGTTNFDDLLSGESSGQQIGFDVSGVSIANARVALDDRQQRRKFEIAKLDVETGKIANGVPSDIKLSGDVKGSNPAIDARVSLKSGFTIDLDQKHYVLKGADAAIKGRLGDFSDLAIKAAGDADLKPGAKRFVLDGIKLTASGKRAGQAIDVRFDAPRLAITDTRVTGGKLSGEAKLAEGARTVTANFAAPSFEGSPQAFKVPSLALDVAVKDAKLDAKTNISGTLAGDIDKLLFTSPQLKLALSGKQGDTAIDGTLSTPLSADMKAQVIELPNIAAAFTLPNPGGGALKLNADGNANVDLGKHTASTVLKGKLDESVFDARVGLSKFSPAAYTFDIGIDRLDADRYKSKPAAAAPKTAAADSKPLDLSALRDLQAAGRIRIGALKAENIKASNVRLDLRAAGGKIDLNPLSANLYDGTVAGSLSATASNPPRFAVRQNLAGINVGPLLKDAIGKEPIEGRGNVNLDVVTEGGIFAQMKKNLNGTARIALRDGAVHGINVAQTIRNAKTRIGELKGSEPPQAGTGSAGEKTDFSELTGSFRIVNGVAHNDDLHVKSPLIRVEGSGDINLADDKLDYLAKTTVVSTLQGQGGPELQTLKGLTLPVRLSGPFAAIGWHIDFRGMATELAKQKVDERKDELRSKAQKSVDEQKTRLQDQLKGLLGR